MLKPNHANWDFQVRLYLLVINWHAHLWIWQVNDEVWVKHFLKMEKCHCALFIGYDYENRWSGGEMSDPSISLSFVTSHLTVEAHVYWGACLAVPQGAFQP